MGRESKIEEFTKTVKEYRILRAWCDRCKKEFTVKDGTFGRYVEDTTYFWEFQLDSWVSKSLELCEDCTDKWLKECGETREEFLDHD